MTGSSHVWTPDLGDLTTNFETLATKYGISKGAGIFSISLLEEEIRLK
ncbi:hypothetical protein AVEN_188494-1, partial [Araneus ventricosus]